MAQSAATFPVHAHRRYLYRGVAAGVCLSLVLCLLKAVEGGATTCPVFTTVCLPGGSEPPAVPQVAMTPAAVPPTFVSAMPAATAAPESSGTAATAQPAASTAPQIAEIYTTLGSSSRQPPSTAAAIPGRALTESTNALSAAWDATEETLHNASVSDGVPQRVAPEPDVPRLSRAEEQQIYSKLLEGLTGSSSDQWVMQGTTIPAAPVAPGNHPVGNETGNPAADDGLFYLQNAQLLVGLSPRLGGSLTYLSSPVMPPEWTNVNLVNTWDSGRLIQQSYYGCHDGSCWTGKPWQWNPVQGGSWGNQLPILLSSSNIDGVINISSTPRNWASQELVEDVTMLTETRLMGSVVKVRFTMRYTGSTGHPIKHQEVPAVFVDRRLNVLATYIGSDPWTEQQLSFMMPGQVGELHKPTERWAAYVDAKSGFGLGIYNPIADQLIAYRVGPENSTAPHHCSYLALLITESVQPDTVVSYDAYIALGRVDEMRKWFADIAATLQQAQRHVSPPSTFSSISLQDAAPLPRQMASADTTPATTPCRTRALRHHVYDRNTPRHIGLSDRIN